MGDLAMSKKVKMHGSFVFAAACLLAAGTAVADDEYPRVETAPAFTYVHNSPVLGGSQSFNCYGFGGTIAVNITSLFGLAADLGGCRVAGLDNTYGVGSKVHVGEGTYVFGPRITFRHGKVQPFLEANVGFEHIRVKFNKKFALRLVQAEYLYTRFGNDCQFAVCSNNNGQNSFRLKSGIVIGWGGPRAAILPPPPPAPKMKPCPVGPEVPIDQDCPKQNISLGIQVSPSAICPGDVSK